MRCGNHRLHNEVRRWKKVDVQMRTCRFCEENKTEDKEHGIMECEGFKQEKKRLFQ